jgi:two-component system, OmpR family, response regulator MtrA
VDERVLLVEDDPSIREMASNGLRDAGFHVTSCADGREALERLRRDPFDLAVLDVMLPSLDGFDVLRELRRISRLSVVMLTARTDPAEVIVGLELGADDYITKPFDMPVLVARCRAVLRRARAEPADAPLQIGDLEIDVAGFAARRDDKDLGLTATEFRLLVELVRRPGHVLTREALLARVWDYEYLGDSRLVDVAVQRLRAKIEDDPSKPTRITTVRGVGYRFERG